MFLPHTSKFTASVEDKTQADGAQVIDVSGSHYLGRWELQFSLSSTPLAGTMTIGIRMPGADGFSDLATTVNLVTGPLAVSFDATIEAIRLTPTSLSVGVSYSAVVVGS